MGVASAIILVLITILCKPYHMKHHQLLTSKLVPPLGVWAIAGCGADLLINVCFTLLG